MNATSIEQALVPLSRKFSWPFKEIEVFLCLPNNITYRTTLPKLCFRSLFSDNFPPSLSNCPACDKSFFDKRILWRVNHIDSGNFILSWLFAKSFGLTEKMNYKPLFKAIETLKGQEQIAILNDICSIAQHYRSIKLKYEVCEVLKEIVKNKPETYPFIIKIQLEQDFTVQYPEEVGIEMFASFSNYCKENNNSFLPIDHEIRREGLKFFALHSPLVDKILSSDEENFPKFLEIMAIDILEDSTTRLLEIFYGNEVYAKKLRDYLPSSEGEHIFIKSYLRCVDSGNSIFIKTTKFLENSSKTSCNEHEKTQKIFGNFFRGLLHTKTTNLDIQEWHDWAQFVQVSKRIKKELHKDLERICDDFTKVLDLQPNHCAALALRGQTYYYLGNDSKGLKDLRQVREIDPKFLYNFTFPGYDQNQKLKKKAFSLQDLNDFSHYYPKYHTKKMKVEKINDSNIVEITPLTEKYSPYFPIISLFFCINESEVKSRAKKQTWQTQIPKKSLEIFISFKKVIENEKNNISFTTKEHPWEISHPKSVEFLTSWLWSLSCKNLIVPLSLSEMCSSLSDAEKLALFSDLATIASTHGSPELWTLWIDGAGKLLYEYPHLFPHFCQMALEFEEKGNSLEEKRKPGDFLIEELLKNKPEDLLIDKLLESCLEKTLDKRKKAYILLPAFADYFQQTFDRKDLPILHLQRYATRLINWRHATDLDEITWCKNVLTITYRLDLEVQSNFCLVGRIECFVSSSPNKGKDSPRPLQLVHLLWALYQQHYSEVIDKASTQLEELEQEPPSAERDRAIVFCLAARAQAYFADVSLEKLPPIARVARQLNGILITDLNDPKNIDMLAKSILEYRTERQTQRLAALADLDRLLTIDPHHGHGLRLKADFLLLQDKIQACKDTVKRLLEFDPNNFLGLKIKVFLYIKEKEYVKALELVQYLLTLPSALNHLFLIRNNIYNLMGKHKEALAEIETLEKHYKKYSYFEKVTALYETKQYEKAYVLIECLIKTNPMVIPWQLQLGQICLCLNKRYEAAKALHLAFFLCKHVLDIEPTASFAIEIKEKILQIWNHPDAKDLRNEIPGFLLSKVTNSYLIQ